VATGDPLERLIELLARLPGIGRKTATRLAFHLIQAPKDYPAALAEALTDVGERVHPCPRCGNYTVAALCSLCTDLRRDDGLLCVVARVQDLHALDRSGGFRGRYHVLHGLLSPLEGVGPEDLNIDALVTRIRESAGAVKEVILAISPSVEGETTVLYLGSRLRSLGPRMTRIAAGVPIGGELEYTDQVTLGRALEDRRDLP
jgi:recombination protein RecR